MKVVLNKCYGGFSLSEAAFKELGLKWDGYGYLYDTEYSGDRGRANQKLVAVVEKLGQKSWGSVAKLRVVEIPDDIKWEIIEYDGMERIEEVHQSWG